MRARDWPIEIIRASVLIFAILIFSPQLALAQFTQQGPKLVGNDAVGPATQGYSVSLSADGNTAIVGGPSDAPAGGGQTGAAWVYTRSGGVWTQQGSKLVGTGAVGTANQGYVALSADGNTAIVGGPDDNSGVGAAWVYTRSGGVWTQQGSKLVGTGADGAASQGTSIALSADGNTAIVGGIGDNNNIGALWVFTRSGGMWTQQGSKLVGTGAAVGNVYQGASVALSADGNTAIVGGYGDNSYAGAAWVFTRSGGVWTQQGSKLVGTGAVGTAGQVQQGHTVALSADGNTDIVGGPGDNSRTGAAWVYTRSGGVWTQQGSKLVGTGAVGTADQGFSVALSADGNTAVLGGVSDNSRTGAVWVFTRSSGMWTQQGSKLVGNGAVRTADQAPVYQGFSVSLSADGNTAIVGGPYDGYTSGLGVGAAWVFAQVPTVTAIAPTSGTTLGGTSVTITGTNFTGATAVTIGGTAATSVTVVNSTTITAVTPANAAGTADVVVTTQGGTGTGSGLYTYVTPAPTVTAMAPTSGTTLGGTSVTITGTNLTGATAVKFGGANAASFNVTSATSITASSPAGSGVVDVRVTTAGGTSATSASDQFTYIPVLQVTPATNMVTAANQGEPFVPSSFQYQLSATTGSINYSISGVPPWLTASATSGTATTTATTVTFTVNASASNLAVGTYGPITITFANSATGQANATVTATLTVNAALATTTTCVKTSKVCPNLWWFNGVPRQPTNYVTTIQAPTGGTDYAWTITEGTQYAQFANHSSTIDTKTKNSVEILPNGDPGDGSPPIVAVTVAVVLKTGTKTANPFILSLRKPYELQPNGIVDKADSTYGYQSQIHYRILDQTGAVLPFPIALNENFTPGVVNDYPGTNWTLPAACGTTHVCSGTYNPSDWYYLVQGAKKGSIPASQPPQSPLGTTMVDHWSGTWGVGSGIPGAGVTVQTNTWQRFQDHARHTNIVSPP